MKIAQTSKGFGAHRSAAPPQVRTQRHFIATSLTSEALDLAYRRYIAGERVRDILAELGLGIAPSEFLCIFPPDPVEGGCSYCGAPLVRQKRARNQPPQAAYCSMCGHCDAPGVRCYCEKCNQLILDKYERLQSQRAEAEARVLVLAGQRYWDDGVQAKPFADWSLESLLWFGAHTLWEREGDSVLPRYLRANFLEATLADGIQVPTRHTPATYFDDTGRLLKSNIERVDLVLGRSKEVIDQDELTSFIQVRIEKDRPQRDRLWLDITSAECLEFVANLLKGSSFASSLLTQELLDSIRDGLTRLASRQVHYALYTSAKNVLANLGARRFSNGIHARNAMLSYFRAQIKRVEQDPQLAHKMWRPADFSRSLLSRYFFNHVLEAESDIGFLEPVRAVDLPRKRISSDGKWKPRCPVCSSLDIDLEIDLALVTLACRVCGSGRSYRA